MPKYYEEDQLISCYEFHKGNVAALKEVLRNTPCAQVRPIVSAHWNVEKYMAEVEWIDGTTRNAWQTHFVCSNCKMPNDELINKPYCGYCGACMTSVEGKDKDEYCEYCIHRKSVEITDGLYEWECDLHEEPQWNRDEERFTCEDYKEAVRYDDF